jgi:ABC-type transport system involved in cytochrome bd biosynthesis fused ATPase/permease subunit
VCGEKAGERTVIISDNKRIKPKNGVVRMLEMAPEKLLSRITMVFQDAYLFKDTIGNNIRVGHAGDYTTNFGRCNRRRRAGG